MTVTGAKTVGVLALQGGFEAHEKMLAPHGCATRQVRVPADLDGLDALVLPGGESTTMTLGIEREQLAQPLIDFIASGKPVLATCAGLILLSKSHLGLLDIHCDRNAYGSQLHSFEAAIDVSDLGDRFDGVFIRAPRITRIGSSVQAIAALDGEPVAVRQGAVIGLAFHPELSGDSRLHELFLGHNVETGLPDGRVEQSGA